MEKEEVEDLQKKRFLFLKKVCDDAHHRPSTPVNMWKAGEALGFDKGLIQDIFIYLKGKGLVQGMTFGTICITQRGIDVVEAAITERDKPTDYFPAYNVIFVEQMVSSQIQQGSPGASQVMIKEEQHSDIRNLISQIKEALKETTNGLGLQNQQIADLHAHIQTIESQLSASKPNNIILTEGIRAIKTILLSAAGSTLAQLVLPKIMALFGE